MRQLITALVLALPVIATTAQAQSLPSASQEGPQRLDVFGDWSVFANTNPRECYATTLALEESALTGAPAPNAAQLLVTYRPSDDPLSESELPGELSFWAGGRAIAQGSSLTARFDGGTRPQITLFTDGAWAWPLDPALDAAAVAAMKDEGAMNIGLLSGAMEAITVSFSLTGFAAAAARAAEHCANMGNLGNLAGPVFTPWSPDDQGTDSAPPAGELRPMAGPEF